MKYLVYFTPTAIKMLKDVPDKAARKKITEKIKALEEDPEKQGKALIGPLIGLRRIVAAGRYRAIYKVDKGKVIVLVLAVGIRKQGDSKDIYALARRLIKLGLLD